MQHFGTLLNPHAANPQVDMNSSSYRFNSVTDNIPPAAQYTVPCSSSNAISSGHHLAYLGPTFAQSSRNFFTFCAEPLLPMFTPSANVNIEKPASNGVLTVKLNPSCDKEVASEVGQWSLLLGSAKSMCTKGMLRETLRNDYKFDHHWPYCRMLTRSMSLLNYTSANLNPTLSHQFGQPY